MIEVHLYGKLRRFAAKKDPRSESIVRVTSFPEETLADVIRRIGIPVEDLGANLFVNGRYAVLDSVIADGDRVGLFPDDMQLLYKWYFDPKGTET